jgi:hypothetical protein
MKRLSIILSLLVLLAPVPDARSQDVSREAGYVDFSAIERSFASPPKVEVNVRGSLLRLVTEASRREDPALADVLSRLKSVQVRTWDMESADRAGVERNAEALSQRLTRGGWDTVVRVREPDSNVGVFLRETGDLISGLTIVVVEYGEATFVNIVGDIDPSEVGMIGQRFNIDGISNVPTGQRRR